MILLAGEDGVKSIARELCWDRFEVIDSFSLVSLMACGSSLAPQLREVYQNETWLFAVFMVCDSHVLFRRALTPADKSLPAIAGSGR